MSRRLLSFTLSAALHAAALAAVLASREVEEERAVFTVYVAWEAAGSQTASGAPVAERPGFASSADRTTATEANAVPLAHPSRRDFAEREIAPQDEDFLVARPHPEELGVADATPGVSKDGPPARRSGATLPAVARDTTETTRSYRRRQVVAAAPAKSPHAESPEEPGSSTAASVPAPAPAAGEPRSAGQTGPALANAADGSASGSLEPSSGRAEAVHRVAPAYPLAARRRGLEGSVLLRVRFDAEGHPEDVVVKTGSGSEMLDGAAREAVRRWRFRGGAAGSVDVPITFRLRGADAVQVTDAGTGREP